MGFGVILASDGELLSEALLGCLVEVRVEQTIDELTAFGVRFIEDIREGEPYIGRRPELQPGRMITVAVAPGDAPLCLVHGPIEQTKTQMTLGGPGSWHEIRGRDRRIELDRVCARRSWEGRASDAVQQLLEDAGFEADVAQTTKLYSEEGGTLNQRATDQEFIRRMARQNNLGYWVTYDCSVSGQSVDVTETVHVKPSPDRPTNDEGGLVSVAEVQLAPTSGVVLRINPGPEACPTVTRFDVDVDVERPDQFEGNALNARDGEEDRLQVEDPQPPVEEGGQSLSDVSDTSRSICVTSPGDAEEMRPRAESAMTDAGWFVDADASSTVHRLGGVLQPHEIVSVTQAGRIHSGAYQVKSVTHVINAANHHLDMALRRNAIGRP